MWKCKDCGEVFEEPKETAWAETFEGQTFRFAEDHCPYCDSEDIGEVEECQECGEYDFRLFNGICEGCLKELAYDEQTAWDYGADYTEKVEINGLLAYLFPDVNEALLKLAKGMMMNNEHTKYCLEDLDAFSDFLSRRQK